MIARISDRWSGNDKAILKLLFESHVLVRIDILRYLGNGSQQMGLLVDGVSLLDGGEWVVQIRFGPRWVAVPFEVLLGDGDQDVSGSFSSSYVSGACGQQNLYQAKSPINLRVANTCPGLYPTYIFTYSHLDRPASRQGC